MTSCVFTMECTQKIEIIHYFGITLIGKIGGKYNINYRFTLNDHYA